MGDYKPEFVYEDSGVIEIDPRDDAAITSLNRSAEAKLVALPNDLDLPVIAGYRLLASKLTHAIRSAQGSPGNCPGSQRSFSRLSCRGYEYQLALCDGIGDAILSKASNTGQAPSALQYFAGGRRGFSRLITLPFMWPDTFQRKPRPRGSGNRASQAEDRDQGLYR
jgi:hypothetical protein